MNLEDEENIPYVLSLEKSEDSQELYIIVEGKGWKLGKWFWPVIEEHPADVQREIDFMNSLPADEQAKALESYLDERMPASISLTNNIDDGTFMEFRNDADEVHRAHLHSLDLYAYMLYQHLHSMNLLHCLTYKELHDNNMVKVTP